MGFCYIEGGRYVKKILKSLDYMIIIISILLFGIGIVALYSANGGVNGDTSEVTKQIVWFLVGIVGMIVVLMIDYDLLGKLWIPIYILTILSLIAVLFTPPINGATSWFQFGGVSIQPGEIAKITLIIGLRQVTTIF